LFNGGAGFLAKQGLNPSLLDARRDLPFRLRALRAAVVEVHAHRADFHVAAADDQP